MISGVIPLNKPRGMTSFACISKLRHLAGQKRVGHSGTLDPDVDGVLPICLGYATKIVPCLMDSGKIYRGSITLGFSTTTEDLSGEVIDKKPVEQPLTDNEIDATLKSFLGESIQIPPMYSAVKVNGRRLYQYARAGEVVKRPKRHIYVTKFKQTKPSKYNPEEKTQTIYFEVSCGKGTYVRTLASDFGAKVGLPAVMSDLTRVKSGGFTLQQAISFEQLEEAGKKGTLKNLVIPIHEALPKLPVSVLSSSQWDTVKNGGFLSSDSFPDCPSEILLQYNKVDRAIYYFDEESGQYKPKVMFDLGV